MAAPSWVAKTLVSHSGGIVGMTGTVKFVYLGVILASDIFVMANGAQRLSRGLSVIYAA
jgi:hypothetical protein